MRHVASAIIVFLVVVIPVLESYGQSSNRDRRAQAGMKFLSVSVHARAAAMADAMTAQEASATAMFYNPASMAYQENSVDVVLGQTQWLAGTTYNMVGASFRPAGGAYGVFGLSLVAVDYGENFIETIRADNAKGFIDLGSFSPSAMSIGLGYGRALTDRFSVGANLKYVRQALGGSTMSVGADESPVREEFAQGTPAIDFGILYRTGFRSLNFALSARNFSRELTYAEENFELPLTFRMGLSIDALDFTELDQGNHDLLVTVDAERPRDFAEQIKAGMEYRFMNVLALRAGYVFPTDEQGVSLGAGLQTSVGGIDVGADYAYTQFGTFGSVSRFALQFGL